MTIIGHNAAAGAAMALAHDDDPDAVVFHYVQWHIGDYIAGTMGLSLEQEGAYKRFLARLYHRGKPLPDDDRFMAAAMALSLRVWKRLKAELVELGKIILRGGCLTNNRFEKERQKRAAEMRKRSQAAQMRWAKPKTSGQTSGKFAPSLPETSSKFAANSPEKPNKINDPAIQVDMLTNNQNPITNKIDSTLARALAPGVDRSREGLDQLQDKLLLACNGAAANPASCPAILSMAEPIRWMENGCDLELDILPTIRARAHRMNPQSVRNWRYFSQAIADAKAAREQPMPEPSKEAPRPQVRYDERRARALEHHDFVKDMIAGFEKEIANAEG